MHLIISFIKFLIRSSGEKKKVKAIRLGIASGKIIQDHKFIANYNQVSELLSVQNFKRSALIALVFITIILSGLAYNKTNNLIAILAVISLMVIVSAVVMYISYRYYKRVQKIRNIIQSQSEYSLEVDERGIFGSIVFLESYNYANLGKSLSDKFSFSWPDIKTISRTSPNVISAMRVNMEGLSEALGTRLLIKFHPTSSNIKKFGRRIYIILPLIANELEFILAIKKYAKDIFKYKA